MDAKVLINKGLTMVKAKSPIILAGVAIIGVGASIGLAIYCDRKAKEKIQEDLKEENEGKPEEEQKEDFTTSEKIKRTWKCYAPVAAVGGITIGSIIMSKRIDLKRQAALMALWTAAETNKDELEAKFEELFGKNKVREAKEKVAEDRAKCHVWKDYGDYTGNKMRCLDEFGREFLANPNQIDYLQNDFNRRLQKGEDYIALNEFYEEIGLSHTGHGENAGWCEGDWVEIEHDTTVMNDQGFPCLMIQYNVGPLWSSYKHSEQRWKPSASY